MLFHNKGYSRYRQKSGYYNRTHSSINIEIYIYKYKSGMANWATSSYYVRLCCNGTYVNRIYAPKNLL